MFKKILYPTDFSECAEKALGYVKKLKEGGTKEVVLVHVVDKNKVIVGREVELAELEEFKKEAKQRLEKIKHDLERLGFQCSIKVQVGTPFVKIIQLAEKEDVSLIVVGSHGKSLVAEMLLGSTAEKVIRKAAKPVLVVRREMSYPFGQWIKNKWDEK